jgi:hypothetical protein
MTSQLFFLSLTIYPPFLLNHKVCGLSFTAIFSQLPSVSLVYNHYHLHDPSERIPIPTPHPNVWKRKKIIAHSPRTMLTDIPSGSRSMTFLEGLPSHDTVLLPETSAKNVDSSFLMASSWHTRGGQGSQNVS